MVTKLHLWKKANPALSHRILGLVVIGLLSQSVVLTGCMTTRESESQTQEDDEEDPEREVRQASKREEPVRSSETQPVVVVLKNSQSFQGSVPNQVLTDVLVAMEDDVRKNPKDLGLLVTYLGMLRLHGQGGQIYDSVVKRAGSIGAKNPWFLLESGYGALVRRDFGLADYLFDKAQKLAGGSGDARNAVVHARGVSLLLQNRVQLAVFEMKQAAGGSVPYLPSLLTLGFMGLRYGDYEGAEKSFRAAMALAPKNLNSRVGLAAALRVRGNAQQAIPIIQSAYKERDNDRRIAWNLAVTLAEVPGKQKEAIAVLERYFQMPGSLPEVDGKATQLLNELKAKPGS